MYSFLFIQLNLSLKKNKFEPLLVNILTKPCSYNDKNVKSWQNISSSTETGQKYFVYLFQAKISNNSQIGLGYSQKLRDGKLSIIISIVKGLGLWCLMPLSVILWRSVLLVEETKSSQRNPLTCRKSLTNLYHIMLYRLHLAWAVFELTNIVSGDMHSWLIAYVVVNWWYALIAQVVVYPTTIWSWPRRPSLFLY